MNLSRIAKQIRREATANPKKAAALGILALVAAYFWAPLVMSQFGGKTPKSSTIASTAKTEPARSSGDPASTSTAQPADGNKSKPEPASYPWSDLVQWMDQDPRTKPAGRLTLGRDPFARRVVKEVVVPVKQEVPKKIEPDFAPQSLSLVLSSTILGAKRRMARINGETYQQGGTLETALKDGKPITFVLKQVDARRVVLEREGKQYELTIQSVARPGRLELLGSVQ